MKIKQLMMYVGIGMLMTACSDDLVESPNGKDNGVKQVYMSKVNLVFPTESNGKTRADIPQIERQTDDGAENEYYVNNDRVYFKFFDKDYKLLATVSGKDIKWEKETGNDHITQKSGTIRLEVTTMPSSVVALLNVDQDMEGPITGAITSQNLIDATDKGKDYGKREFVREHFAKIGEGTTGNFLMLNSSYWEGLDTENPKLIQAVPVNDDNFYQLDDKGDPVSGMTPQAINIYVERVVAKVTLNMDSEKNETTEDGCYKVSVANGSETKIKVKLLGWGLNATNKTFYPLKKISQDGTIEWDWEIGWNDETNHRCYWAKDPNYDNASYLQNISFTGTTINSEADLDFHYYSINNIISYNNFNGKTGNAEYCLENTMKGDYNKIPGAVTHAILVGQYVDSNNESADIYRYNGTIYTEEELKTLICNNGCFTDFATPTKEDIEIEKPAKNYSNRIDSKITKIYYTGTNDAILKLYGKNGTSNLKDVVFGQGRNVWYYKNGYCYYAIPIKHIANKGKTETGYYGVVRNHWYDLKITLAGFGEPADPDKPIVPEESAESEYAVQAVVNVLSWAKKEQSSNVGGDVVWGD